MSNLPSEPIDEVVIETKPRSVTGTRRVPPYHVILENDDCHSFGFVLGVLQKALGYSQERAFQLTLLAHHSGRAVVWTGAKEVAELKFDQIRSFHEIRDNPESNLGPVGCSIEPAPGG